MKKCKHRNGDRRHQDALCGIPAHDYCGRCGATPSLGPSNDEPPEVQIEIRAAEIAAWAAYDGLTVSIEAPDAIDGWLGRFTSDPTQAESECAGWLAAEMSVLNMGSVGPIDSWPWDPTRPVAGQYEEHVRRSSVNRQNAQDEALHREAHALNAPVRDTAASIVAAPTGKWCSEHRTHDCTACPWRERQRQLAADAERRAIAGATAARHAERDAGACAPIRDLAEASAAAAYESASAADADPRDEDDPDIEPCDLCGSRTCTGLACTGAAP